MFMPAGIALTCYAFETYCMAESPGQLQRFVIIRCVKLRYNRRGADSPSTCVLHLFNKLH